MVEADASVDLTGETALVVGGTRNIGLAIAQALLGAGANVCVVGGSDSEALASALQLLGAQDGEATGLVADITDEAAVVNAFEHTERILGPVSILVNGPGYRPHGPFMDISLESWNSVLDIMLTGPFLTCRELFRRLPVDRKGAIVNIGGLSAHRPAKGSRARHCGEGRSSRSDTGTGRRGPGSNSRQLHRPGANRNAAQTRATTGSF